MAAQKQATVMWKGEDLKFHATLGSGYEFEMEGPATPAGGSPVEFLIAGAVGCTAMDMIHILKRRRQNITGLDVEIKGIQAEDAPNVFTDATVVYVVRGENIDPAAVERAIDLSMSKYCSASIMLKRAGMNLTTEYRIEEAVAV
jgi:putative redox protein